MRLKMIMTVLTLAMLQSAPSSAKAGGVMRQRAAPSVPATTETGCMIEVISGGHSDAHFRVSRAKDQAIRNWKKEVKRRHGPEFSHWKHANRYTKEILCQGAMKAQHRCYARATLCRKPD